MTVKPSGRLMGYDEPALSSHVSFDAFPEAKDTNWMICTGVSSLEGFPASDHRSSIGSSKYTPVMA